MSEVKTRRRPYRSARRQGQLDSTRQAILQAARRLFREGGYTRTTIAAIAAEADLAVPTVYKHFGTKRRLLLDLIDATINVRVQAQLSAVLDQPTPRARLAALARMCVDLASGAPDVVSVALSASAVDPELGVMFQQMAEGRLRSAALVARSLAAEGSLSSGVSEERARDVMFALASPELYEVLVARFGWSDDEFEAWLSSTLAASLLDLSSP
jgi:TetR/AcrR family transcriptional regulator, regulator of autoinduction and epiphytic fitness